LKIVFAGTPEFARVALAGLLTASSDGSPIEIVAVYTQPDRPAGRGLKLTPSPVKLLAQAHGIVVEQPLSLRHASALEQLRRYPCDLMVVAAYGLILPQAVLDHPRLGCVNIHASLLPRWRGAAPIVRAIQAGDRTTGISIMKMDAGLDTGAVYDMFTCPIEPTDTASLLHDKLAALGSKALLTCLPAIAKQSLLPKAQTEEGATYAAKILKSEALIDWTQSAQSITDKVRAFDPFPGCTMQINQQVVKVWSATPVALEPAVSASVQAGQFVRLTSSGLLVACGSSSQDRQAVLITCAQWPGSKRISGAALQQALNSLNLQFHSLDT
jgi:methionyl-tRNA formyltransferase